MIEDCRRKGRHRLADKLAPKKPPPSRKDTIRIFEYEIQLKKKSLEELMSIEDDGELQIEHQVWEQRLGDEIYLRFGVEKDDYN